MPRLNAGQAHYVLERLVSDRRVSAKDVDRIVSDMQREISQLEERLQSLRTAAGAGAPSRAPRSAAKPAARGRRRTRITAEQLASRKLQGRYLGLIRQIPASQRGRYAKTAKLRGREAAIKEMEIALKK